MIICFITIIIIIFVCGRSKRSHWRFRWRGPQIRLTSPNIPLNSIGFFFKLSTVFKRPLIIRTLVFFLFHSSSLINHFFSVQLHTSKSFLSSHFGCPKKREVVRCIFGGLVLVRKGSAQKPEGVKQNPNASGV